MAAFWKSSVSRAAAKTKDIGGANVRKVARECRRVEVGLARELQGERAVNLWRRYLGWYRGQYVWIAAAVAIAAIQSLLVFPAAWLVAWVFDHSIPSGEFPMLLAPAGGLLTLNLLSGALSLWNRHLTLRSTKIATRDMRAQLLRKLYSFSRTFYDKGDRSGLHSTIVQDSERVDRMSNALVGQLVPAAFTATVIAAALLYLNATLFVVLAAVAPLLVLVNRWFGRRLKASMNRFRKSFNDFSSGVLFLVNTIDLARVQSAEEMEIERQRGTLDELRVTSGRAAWLTHAYNLSQTNVSIMGSIVILIAGGHAVADARMTIGELMSFYVVVGLLRNQVTSIVGAVPQIVLGGQALATLDEMLRRDEVAEYRGRGRIRPRGAFALRDVSFSYGEEPVLKNVNLELPPSRAVAVVGANGSGKSTLIYLLCGFYRPQAGRVLADGRPYDQLDIADLRRSMAVVLQDPTFFSGSILDNITYGAKDVQIDRVREACRLATALEFIESLPDGYEAEIGDNGVRLSGGQRQRIAVARALYRRPKLLILDEPTNHLDVDSIDQLLKNLSAAIEPPTTLLVSHDVRVVRQADEVFALENGRLSRLSEAERDSWTSLMAGLSGEASSVGSLGGALSS